MRKLRTTAYFRQDGKCWWCNTPMKRRPMNPSDPRTLTADHVLPLSKGGLTSHGNIVAACRKCNNERADKDDRASLQAGNPAPISPFEALAGMRAALAKAAQQPS